MKQGAFYKLFSTSTEYSRITGQLTIAQNAQADLFFLKYFSYLNKDDLNLVLKKINANANDYNLQFFIRKESGNFAVYAKANASNTTVLFRPDLWDGGISIGFTEENVDVSTLTEITIQ